MPNEKGSFITTKTWTPAVPLKRPDNIISSDYARASRVFTPSYERNCRPCIEQLIANEYQRMWWQERDAWGQHSLEKVKGRKLRGKNEGSSENVALAKSPSTKNLPTLQTKVSKEDVSTKTREKNLKSAGTRKIKR